MKPHNSRLLPVLAAVAAEMRGGPKVSETLGATGPDLTLALGVAIDAGLIKCLHRPELTRRGIQWAAARLDGLRPLVEVVDTAADMIAAEIEVGADD